MMKTIKRLTLITGVVLLALTFTACPASSPVELVPIVDMPSLWMIYESYFPMGNIIANRYRNDFANSRRIALLTHHFNLLTAENEMKPNVMRTGAAYPGTWNWSQAEALLGFARDNEMRFHGHTLAWHSQSPSWLAATGIGASATPLSPEEAIRRLEYHIREVMTRFGTRVESWDVVNEVIMSGGPGLTNVDIFGNTLGNALVTPPPNQPLGRGFPMNAETPGTDGAGIQLPWNAWDWRTALRNPNHDPTPDGGINPGNQTNWVDTINRATANERCFVEIAFLKARVVADEIEAANPGHRIILYYNDYNLNIPRKRLAVFHMVRDINDRNRASLGGRNLIQAIGMQAHYWLPNLNVTGAPGSRPGWAHIDDVRASMERFAELGVYVSITELDVFAGPGPELEMRQAEMYARLFQLFRQFAYDNRFPAGDGLPERSVLRRVSIWGVDDPASWRSQHTPLLFDANLNPKLAFWAVAAPDAFVDPQTGILRSTAEINAFLENPRAALGADGTPLIPENAWLPLPDDDINTLD